MISFLSKARPSFCFCFLPVHGGWSNWTEWSQCSVSCGFGVVSRYRHCNSPSPVFGGDECRGSRKEEKICEVERECPGKATKHVAWRATFLRFFSLFGKLLSIFINPNTSLHSVVFLSTFRSDCAAFIRMTNGRLAETGTFKVFSKKLALVKTSHNKLKVQKKWKMLHKKK